MRNSGKEKFIPAFFEELMSGCKAGLDYEQTKVLFSPLIELDHCRLRNKNGGSEIPGRQEER